MRNTLLVLIGLLCAFSSLAQRKAIEAVRTSEKIQVDGLLNETVWQNAPKAEGFIQNRPDAGSPSQRTTEVRLLYDDDAIYVAAILTEEPENIFNFLSNRDQLGNSDFFGVIIDPYNAGQNGVGLLVTPSGVQFDTYYSSNGEDANWNAVWTSKTSFTETGWIVEFKIPYAVLRFATKPIQDWGINFVRESRSKSERSWWSEVNPNVSGFLNQAGELKGLKDIKAPARLFLYPYASTVVVNDGASGESDIQVNGGLDLKYGINDAFTLDMTLIPDFSGVRSDNQVLNLTPFEVRFAENRQFFTEGTELFNKGGLFYSRRIGSSFGNIAGKILENEEIIVRPSDAPLINATKISGRTNSGLGIGFFNAMSDRSFIKVRNTETGDTREVEADPFTNFNVLVLDQNLRNNSSATFINTSVLRANGIDDANVSALTFSVNDKNIKWNISGFGSMTQKFSKSPETGVLDTDIGHAYAIRLAKVSGKFRYGVTRNVESDNYNPNDLGFLQSPNEVGHSVNFGFNQVKPFWKLNRLNINASVRHQKLYKPDRYASWNYTFNLNGQLKNFWNFGLHHNNRPSAINDFFEPRHSGWHMIKPKSADLNLWVASDNRKKLRGSIYSGIWRSITWNQFDNWIGGNLNFQISSRFQLNHNLHIIHQRKSRGYATTLTTPDGSLSEIIIGQRDINDVVNTTNFSYIFTNRMGLTLRLRHYWSRVFYYDFYQLQTNGELGATTYTGRNDDGDKLHDVNFNLFNVDLVYNWQFAPGSELRIVWKRASSLFNRNTHIDFLKNLGETTEAPSLDSFTIKMLYFIDYQNIKRVFQGK